MIQNVVRYVKCHTLNYLIIISNQVNITDDHLIIIKVLK